MEKRIKEIIKKLLQGDDYRGVVIDLINEKFLDDAITFFKKVAEAKLDGKVVTPDWYKEEFLSPTLAKEEIATSAGLNIKTIHNVYNTTKKKIVIDASNKHYDALLDLIGTLTENEEESFGLKLTIKLNGVSVDLDIKESLVVINALAVKRAQLRGGAWSEAGKSVEKPLMVTLCKLYAVSANNYSESPADKPEREADFFLLQDSDEYPCEIKLMGGGNPESADGAMARNSTVFIADKLSKNNKKQLEDRKIHWVELRTSDDANADSDSIGFRKFEQVLQSLQIPHKNLDEDNLDGQIEKILEEYLQNKF